MSITLFISYALPHCTVEMVKDVFDELCEKTVLKVAEKEMKDRKTGKPFKLFWITLDESRPELFYQIRQAEHRHGAARITYESTNGKDRWWNVVVNKEKVKEVKKEEADEVYKGKFVPYIIVFPASAGDIDVSDEIKEACAALLVKIEQATGAEKARLSKEYMNLILR